MPRVSLGLCVSLAAKACVCRQAKTHIHTHTHTAMGARPLWRQVCGVKTRVQVLLGDRCVWRQAGVHFHTNTRWTALSTPDPHDRQGDGDDDEADATHHHHHHHHQEAEKVEALDTAMAKLQDLFGLSEKDAQYVLVSCSGSDLTEQDVLSNLHLLHQCGIDGHQLHRIPWILGNKADVLQRKLVKLEEPFLFRQICEGLGFCYLSVDKMTSYQGHFRKEAATFPHHPNRIYYLADRIKVPVKSLSERIGKPHRILTWNIQRLDSIIDLFHYYGLSPEDIVADLWVFEYSRHKTEDRLRRAKEIGCTKLRPWMCRSSDKIFDRFCERYQSRKELMGDHHSVFDFLAKRLECEASLVEEAFERNEVMWRVHVTKFSRILDLLYAEGITAQEIRTCMRVFQYSATRTAWRIKELKKVGFFPFPLIVVCKTPGQFKEIVSQYKKKFRRRL